MREVSTPDPTLQSIIWGRRTNGQPSDPAAPHLVEFDIPESLIGQNRLLTPQTNLSISEGELLFVGTNLQDYQVGYTDNPFPLLLSMLP